VKTWLLAWESGAGLGHLRRLAAIARPLAQTGDRIVVVAPEPEAVHLAFPADLAAETVPAPALPAPRIDQAEGFLPSYGAVLRDLGFENAGYLTAMTRAWDEVLARVQPSAVIADHAPFAVFAARGRFPTAVLGAGLDLPPAHGSSFPMVIADAKPFDETRLRMAFAAAAAATGRPNPYVATAALRGDRRFLAGLPVFDPYLNRRLETHLGPLGPRPAPSPCPSEGAIFAYLRSDHPSFGPLTWALVETGIPALVHWQGPPDAGTAALLATRGITVSHTPVDTVAELAKASVVISLGGAGLTAEALFAGRPHMVYPIHMESELNALGLERLGAGRRFPPFGLREMIDFAADSLALRDGAMRAALELHRDFGIDPAGRIAADIRELA